MTTLLLRADAGPSIGVGHLSRCVALAEAAVARGWRVVLAGSVTVADWLVARLSTLDVPIVPAERFAPADADIVVVDHYGLGELPDVREAARLVSLEDGPFGRRAADVVVDANLVVAPRPPDGSPVVLAGPRFAPLRSDVVEARASRRGADSLQVVVVMGGGATGEAVSAALSALRDTGVPLVARAISTASVHVDPAGGQKFVVEPPTPALPALLARADLVISAAGVTLLELCCLGVPGALVQLADNQATGYRAAVDQGLAAGLGTVADLPAAVPALRALLHDPDRRSALSRAGSKLVDGRGASRILDACELTIRPASPADAGLLLTWRNDPETLRWSRGHQPVAEGVHQAWLHNSLENPDRLLLIAETDHPVGTVRFDRLEPGTWEVSITVAPADRGKGLASRLLMIGEGALQARHPATQILANVHEANKPSLTLFHHAGYEPTARPPDGSYVWLAKQGCPQPADLSTERP
ncbi:MAG TPA: bifunctional UDP-2,4-diacetamido-2,4,6-trideoxy-beta-L-altropyranose hydrolase/GNAT family N-acetyltransferase [Actinophytocola sp.]|uniref:bifunctional UDP-2,4-diacetamido-2,4,6-trideoxy-beta-L-altropyranose hydrolase/GNAT family N-acetyltransferase n=1 Tax=Actinophytocola sp. TaxID=1872138 RepID=UPI002F93289B